MPDPIKIAGLLLKKHPKPSIALNYNNPLQLLVATILSAQCTDARVNQVTGSLFIKFKEPADYIRAGAAALEAEIKSINYYKTKAKAIIACCLKIQNNFGGKVPDSMEELTTLPGVGRKTANVILSGAFGKQTIPVDTHVLRVSNRLGLTFSKNPEKVETDLMRIIPLDKWSRFSLAMILHGRNTCKAKKPLCTECFLYHECSWPDKG